MNNIQLLRIDRNVNSTSYSIELTEDQVDFLLKGIIVGFVGFLLIKAMPK